jgi:hypothetical protein
MYRQHAKRIEARDKVRILVRAALDPREWLSAAEVVERVRALCNHGLRVEWPYTDIPVRRALSAMREAHEVETIVERLRGGQHAHKTIFERYRYRLRRPAAAEQYVRRHILAG